MSEGLDRYPAGQLTEEMKLERIGVLGQASNTLLRLRQFEAAETGYRALLDALDELQDPQGETAGRPRAIAWHQLGIVAQERRDFAAAEEAYRKALEIFQTFDDPHSAALTWHQLGMVAEERRDFAAAEEAYRTALEIFVAANNEHSVAIVIRSCARLGRDDPDRTEELVSMVAGRTEMDTDQVRDLFAKTPNDTEDQT